jgi:hypothetical protein
MNLIFGKRLGGVVQKCRSFRAEKFGDAVHRLGVF